MDLTYFSYLCHPEKCIGSVFFCRAEYWKCVSIGFVMPLGHYLYRHRLQQVVVLSSTIDGQYKPEDYN